MDKPGKIGMQKGNFLKKYKKKIWAGRHVALHGGRGLVCIKDRDLDTSLRRK